MKTLKEQTEAKIASGRKAKPEFMEGVDKLILEQKQFKAGENALALGSKAPEFTLPNATGEDISLSSLLSQGPIVLTFYRGSWCPYCNLQLRALQENLSDIKSLGASLVAITPEVPDDSLGLDDIRKMEFSVLTDQGAMTAKEYGVAWKVPDMLLEHMKVDRELDLAKINNGNADVLPIPATFVLDRTGKVVWRFVDVDYRKRSEPSDILEVLKKL